MVTHVWPSKQRAESRGTWISNSHALVSGAYGIRILDGACGLGGHDNGDGEDRYLWLLGHGQEFCDWGF